MNYKKSSLNTSIHIDNLVSLHYFCYSKDFCYSGESHDFCELVYVDSGEVIVIDGNDKHILKQGEGYLHEANVFHNIYPNEKFSNIAIISFYAELPALILKKKLIFNDEDKSLISTIINEGRELFSEPLNLLFLEQMTKNTDASYAAEQVVKNCVELLLISLVRSQLKQPLLIAKSGNSLTDSINSILAHSLHKGITLTKIAKMTGYSCSYIKRIYKEVSGTSILNAFNNMKIDEAKKYLSEGLTASQICEALHFESEQYFCRQFKKYTNMTPGQYKKSVKLMRIL